ncbi:hypothetical protein Mrose_03556 [Calidithermus roseus]|uniref:Uncharacterized protein n=1 Tax=Calidithermus roseus TaxID=1644118 RepID=A0A399EDQ7_9DEIN|nr:hypothetical protein Mrose_03556 [Calidithermus roseus]
MAIWGKLLAQKRKLLVRARKGTSLKLEATTGLEKLLPPSVERVR